MLNRILIAGALAAVPMLMPAAAHAQSSAQNSVLIIYGNDKCPTNSNGEEIVVCKRLDEAERFRIPSNLRDQGGPPQKTESWAVRSQDAVTAGNFGTGSCTSVGANGSTGCFVKRATAARAETRARRKAEQNLPLP
ncbi:MULTISPECIES: hypothetical protein [Sphingomonas]|uniref:DUF4189 domain-containing protein n=1 Tax=Sphingomonas kyeonggiensis TaxID=1268553 RepID=A0A7W7JZ78_9SPHN|nr:MULTISPECIES: hypothetical protein [Sphingomonas]MBB4838091.1 hypothetical protein [Sphingomonas kyeonggiensis]WHU01448.1 hypothetical protein O3305_14715 [Sphingomonas sp. NIBR02145]